MTPYEKQCEILAELWIMYGEDERFSEFINYYDLGLPLAYAITEKIVKNTDESQALVAEAFNAFLQSLEVEDEGFDTLYDLFDVAGLEYDE